MLAANYLMMCDQDGFMHNIDTFAENTADIAYLVGGSAGMFKVNKALMKHEIEKMKAVFSKKVMNTLIHIKARI